MCQTGHFIGKINYTFAGNVTKTNIIPVKCLYLYFSLFVICKI